MFIPDSEDGRVVGPGWYTPSPPIAVRGCGDPQVGSGSAVRRAAFGEVLAIIEDRLPVSSRNVLAVPMVDQTNAVQSEIGSVHGTMAKTRKHCRRMTAGYDYLRLAGQLSANVLDQSPDHVQMAPHESGLHCRARVPADCRSRLNEIDGEESGGARRQCLECHAQTGSNRSAQESPRRIDRFDFCRRAQIHDDSRAAAAIVRRNGVCDPIRANFARVVHPERDAKVEVRPDDQGRIAAQSLQAFAERHCRTWYDRAYRHRRYRSKIHPVTRRERQKHACPVVTDRRFERGYAPLIDPGAIGAGKTEDGVRVPQYRPRATSLFTIRQAPFTASGTSPV